MKSRAVFRRNIVEEFDVVHDLSGIQRCTITPHSNENLNVLPGPVVLIGSIFDRFSDYSKTVVPINSNSTDGIPNHISVISYLQHFVHTSVFRVIFHRVFPTSNIITHSPIVSGSRSCASH